MTAARQRVSTRQPAKETSINNHSPFPSTMPYQRRPSWPLALFFSSIFLSLISSTAAYQASISDTGPFIHNSLKLVPFRYVYL